MITIALDTSLDVRVAVADGATVLARAGLADPRAHVEQLIPLLAKALAEAGDPAVERVVVGVGPGPFTGLRVGIAAAQTWAMLRGAELVGVCSLDVLAAQTARASAHPADADQTDIDQTAAAQTSAVLPDEFSVVTDARRGEWYHARYNSAGVRQGEPGVAAPDQIPGPHVGPVVADAGGVRLTHLDAGVMATGDFPAMPVQALYLRDPDATVPTRRKSALVPGLVLPTRRSRS